MIEIGVNKKASNTGNIKMGTSTNKESREPFGDIDHCSKNTMTLFTATEVSRKRNNRSDFAIFLIYRLSQLPGQDSAPSVPLRGTPGRPFAPARGLSSLLFVAMIWIGRLRGQPGLSSSPGRVVLLNGK